MTKTLNLLLAGLLLCSLTGVLSGCSRDPALKKRPKTYPVTGLVTMDGIPMANATIVLESKSGGPAASAISKENGTFSLTTFDADDGAVPGEYAVVVMQYEKFTPPPGANADTTPTKPAALISPIHYSDFSKSGLTASVSDTGKNVLNLDLTSKK